MATNSRVLSKAEVRHEALKMLRDAKSIFIIYSAADLAIACDLRRRIIRVRRESEDDTVFLAAESLPVGEDVSPQFVRTKLSEADLAVVACGEQTSRSPFVIEEVEQTLAQRSAGRTNILPVILKTGVRLPQGLDFAVQAIHRAVLFPAIKWLRLAIAGTVSGLAIAALVLIRQNQITEIRRRLDLDDLTQHSPIDLGRVAALEALSGKAKTVFFSDGVRIIDQKLRMAATSSLRQEWFHPDPQRIAILTDPAEKIIWIGYESRIDAIDARNRQIVRSYDLTKLKAEYFQPELIREGQVEAVKPDGRNVCKLLLLKRDSRVRGILAEVEYERFAKPDAGWKDPGQGHEREVLVLELNNRFPRSAGLSVAYESVDGESPDGLDYGTEWEEYHDKTLEVEETLSKLSDAEEQKVRAAVGATDPEDRILLLARDPLGLGILVRVEIRRDKRMPADFKNVDGMRDYFAGIFTQDQGFRRAAALTRFHPRARFLALTEGRDPSTDIIPQYEPAAVFLKSGRAWIHDLPLRLTADFNPDEFRADSDRFAAVTNLVALRWLIDGSATCLQFTDGSVARCSADADGAFHRFLRPSGARGIDLSPDGGQLIVLHGDGRLDSWEMDAFGASGWRGPAGADPKLFVLATK